MPLEEQVVPAIKRPGDGQPPRAPGPRVAGSNGKLGAPAQALRHVRVRAGSGTVHRKPHGHPGHGASVPPRSEPSRLLGNRTGRPAHGKGACGPPRSGRDVIPHLGGRGGIPSTYGGSGSRPRRISTRRAALASRSSEGFVPTPGPMLPTTVAHMGAAWVSRGNLAPSSRPLRRWRAPRPPVRTGRHSPATPNLPGLGNLEERGRPADVVHARREVAHAPLRQGHLG